MTPPLRGSSISGRRERVAVAVLAGLIVVVEVLLLITFLRGSQATNEIGATSHFLTSLANVQREVLRLQVAVVETAGSADRQRFDVALEAVTTQRAILESQIRTLRGGVSDSIEADASYRAIAEHMTVVDDALDDLDRDPTVAKLASTEFAVADMERAVKRAYDIHEIGYFRRTSDTLAAQAATHLLLLVVAIVIAALATTIGFVLRRRVRAEFAVAYYRLEAEVHQRTEAQDMLRHQAYHDALTGLPNRVAFGERLAEALDTDPQGVAVLFIDLDDFKAINDALGHAAGDELLRATAERLNGALRDGDIAARLGGDEFAVLVTGSRDVSEADKVARRILDALHQPIPMSGRTLHVQASVGIAMGGAEDLGADEVMRNADIAMYLAKGQGKGRSEIYQPAMHVDVLRRLALRADLEAAVSGNGLVLHYQPIVDLESNTVTGVEALVRWLHPDRGLVPPADFIPLAEDTGLIVPLGRWVLREACRQVAAWQAELGRPLEVSINVSPLQLKHPGLLLDVRDAIELSGIDPADVILEITETGVVEHGAASEALFDLRALGVRIAVDDFGTGYSSLGHLGRLPIDILKIDRTFIQALGRATKETALTATIVRLASSLSLATVAEGVEDADQLARVRGLGCESAQGFLLSKPMDAEAAHRFLVAGAGTGASATPVPTASRSTAAVAGDRDDAVARDRSRGASQVGRPDRAVVAVE